MLALGNAGISWVDRECFTTRGSWWCPLPCAQQPHSSAVVGFWGGPVQSQELGLVIPMGPFHLQLFYDCDSASPPTQPGQAEDT